MAKVEYPQDPVVERVVNSILERSERGMEKYGMAIADHEKDLVAWLRDIQEELTDATVYIERAIQDINYARLDRLADRESK